jgi:hypothetical protein
LGQHVDDLVQPEYKKAAGIAGGIVAYAVTVALVYLREWLERLWK